MKHEAELLFFRDILRNSNIPCHIIDTSDGAAAGMAEAETPDINYDFGLRILVAPELNYKEQFLRLCHEYRDNTLYRISDPFLCQYYFLRIPDAPDLCVLTGPYTEKEILRQDIMNIAERYGLPHFLVSKFENIYRFIPFIADSSGLPVLLNTLGQRLWGELKQFTIQDVYDNTFPLREPVAIRPESKEPEDAFLSMKALEKQYDAENTLMRAVALGETHTAEMLLGGFSRANVERRNSSALRDLKNYAIIANTLMRKAAEYGHVHPLHIDSLSSRFARSIENAGTKEDIFRLTREMGRKYCLLVKNHSLEGYSSLVRDILVRINSDLTADLSLKTQAAYLHVSASYLSAVFKKETGSSLTEYVNRRRVEYGVFLLNSTNLQIQTIAQHCGIPDLNYFSKTFKKYMGMTPSEYRSTIHTLKTDDPKSMGKEGKAGPRQ